MSEIFKIKDLLFYLSDFLNDHSSFQFFVVNKYIYNLLICNSRRYTIKKQVSDRIYKEHQLDHFKVKKYYYTNYTNSTNSDNLLDIPASVTSLTFIQNFNLPIYKLSDNIRNLTFGHMFDQVVTIYPKNLVTLTFGHRFNQSVDNLPSSLRNLTF